MYCVRNFECPKTNSVVGSELELVYEPFMCYHTLEEDDYDDDDDISLMDNLQQ